MSRRRREPPLKSLVVTQSVDIDGHRSSVSLEGAFWNALREIAVARKIRVSELASMIDKERQPGSNLSSAIRVYVLDYYQRLV
jgi:predicted DNA-binding ribbon-helix-helix protein